jgi:outer membrane biosynthesis protein TonB
MSLPASVKWVLLALLGLAIAIGVAFAAANLASRQIGIASESVSAGDALAPALQAPAKNGGQQEPPPQTTTTPETTTTTEEPPPEETTEPDEHGSDDHGGHGGDSDGDDD